MQIKYLDEFPKYHEICNQIISEMCGKETTFKMPERLEKEM